jgi:hypothetical protein
MKHMKTELHARSIRLGARTLASYFIALSVTGPLFGQSNPCAEALKEGIYNRYKGKTSLNKYSSMKDYFNSQDFEQDVKTGGWSGGISIPIKGVPISLNAGSSSNKFSELKSGIEKLSENQLQEAFATEVEKADPNIEFAKQYFDCVKDRFGKGFSWTAERLGQRAFITIRFMPLSTSDPMPVITDVIVDNAKDILAPTKGQKLDFSNVISAVPKDLKEPVTVTMVTDKQTVYASSSLPSPSPSPTPTFAPTAPPQKKQSFEVLGVGHQDKTLGKYFGFKAKDLDDVLGRKDWNDKVIYVSPTADGDFKKAIVWRYSNGTAGDAHGRYESGYNQGDWKEKDFVYVQPNSPIQPRSKKPRR